MSCATFNVATSLHLHGCPKKAVSKPFGLRHCTFPKFSSLGFETLNLSSTYHSFGRDTPSRSFHSVFKCLAQNSESSHSVSVDRKNNSLQALGLLIEESFGVIERVTVLVIDGGGPEYALCYALQKSLSCETVLCAPGNAGIAS